MSKNKGLCCWWSWLSYEEQWPRLAEFEKKNIPFVLSPLHDKDLYDDGTPKKAHFHGLMYIKNACGMGTAISALDGLAANNYVELVYSPPGKFEYLTHKNEKNKFHYSEDDLQYFNGFDLSYIYNSKDIEKNYYNKVLDDLSRKVMSGDLSNLYDLTAYVLKEYNPAVLSYMTSKTYYFTNLFKFSADANKYKRLQEELQNSRSEALSKAFADGYDLAREYYESYLDAVDYAYAEGRADEKAVHEFYMSNYDWEELEKNLKN
jgi:hypothetical protein